MAEKNVAFREMFERDFSEIANGQRLITNAPDVEIGSKTTGFKIDDQVFINLIKDQIAPIANAKLKDLSGVDRRKVLRLAVDKLIEEATIVASDIDNDSIAQGATVKDALDLISRMTIVTTAAEFISAMDNDDVKIIYNATESLSIINNIFVSKSKTVIGESLTLFGCNIETNSADVIVTFLCDTRINQTVLLVAGADPFLVRFQYIHSDAGGEIDFYFAYESVEYISNDGVTFTDNAKATRTEFNKLSDQYFKIETCPNMRQWILGDKSALLTALDNVTGLVLDHWASGLVSKNVEVSTPELKITNSYTTRQRGVALAVTNNNRVIAFGDTGVAGTQVLSSYNTKTNLVSEAEVTGATLVAIAATQSIKRDKVLLLNSNTLTLTQIMASTDSTSLFNDYDEVYTGTHNAKGITTLNNGIIVAVAADSSSGDVRPLYSIDGGKTFSLSVNPIANSRVNNASQHNNFMLHPRTGIYYFASNQATGNDAARLYYSYSINSGWSLVGPIYNDAVNIEKVICSYMDNDTGFIYVSIWNPITQRSIIRVSENEGVSWSTLYEFDATVQKVTQIIKTNEGAFYVITRDNGGIYDSSIWRLYSGQSNFVKLFGGSALIGEIIYDKETSGVYFIVSVTGSTGFQVYSIDTIEEYCTSDNAIPKKIRMTGDSIDFLVAQDRLAKDERVYLGVPPLSVRRNDVGILLNDDAPILSNNARNGSFYRDISEDGSLFYRGLNGKRYKVGYLSDEVFNTAAGSRAFNNNIDGFANTVFGQNTMFYSEGSDNNCGFGYGALINLINGNYNVGLGRSALVNAVNANYCTAVGDAALLGLVNETNCTGLGYNSLVTGSNQVQLGNDATQVYAYGSAINFRSDVRDKADIRPSTLGLNFIEKVESVEFKWDMRDSYREVVETVKTVTDKEGKEVEIKDYHIVEHERDGSKKRNRYHSGVIAQQVKEVLDELGADWGGYQDHTVNGGKDVLTIGYDQFIGPLIKSVQELSAQIKALELRVQQLENN